jgi:IMP dehydrogenase
VRDLVEIGMGRTARRAYDLDDVEIVPSRRTRSSAVVSTAWQIDAYRFDLPLVTHPTDAVVSPATAVEIGQLGGLGVLNSEGLWARHADVEDVMHRLIDTAKDEDSTALVRLLQELHAAPLQPDLLAESIRIVRESGVTVAARVSPQRAAALTPILIAAGVEILVVQGTIISAEHVSGDSDPLDLKEFIGSLDVPVIAGGVADYRTAMHLMRTGAAGVIVGHGYTPGITSTDRVLGIGVPMATAIMGAPLAASTHAPGHGLYWTAAAAHPSLPRSRVAAGPDFEADLKTLLYGPSSDAEGTINLFGGLRRAMAKTGYSDLKEFQRVGLTVRS